MSLDDILRFVVTIAIYVVIFAVVGIAFHEADKRFKAWVVGRSNRNPPPQSSEPFRAGTARRRKARR